MDSGGGGGANNYRYRRKSPYSDRLLGIFSTAHSLSQPSTSTTSASTSVAGDEISEHDIFDVSSDAVHHSTPSTTSTSPNANANYHRSPNHRSHHKHFGILAALPESESHAQAALLSVSSSSSSSSTSSARLIPMIPKRPPPVDRVKYLQSAPVNVPAIPAAAMGLRGRYFDDVDDDEVDGGDEMLPPHEFVASRQTPILVSSVVEGVGRKLKGRDLRQVRDSIWEKTGFIA